MFPKVLSLFEDVTQAEVFHLQVLIHAMARAFATQTRLLHAAKWHMFGGDDANVDAHHAIFERFAHAVDAANVAAVEIAGQAKLGVVGGVHGFLLFVKPKHRGEGAKRFFAGAQHVGAGVGDDGGLKELAVQLVAAHHDLATFLNSVLHVACDLFHCRVFDEGLAPRLRQSRCPL